MSCIAHLFATLVAIWFDYLSDAAIVYSKLHPRYSEDKSRNVVPNTTSESMTESRRSKSGGHTTKQSQDDLSVSRSQHESSRPAPIIVDDDAQINSVSLSKHCKVAKRSDLPVASSGSTNMNISHEVCQAINLSKTTERDPIDPHYPLRKQSGHGCYPRGAHEDHQHTNMEEQALMNQIKTRQRSSHDLAIEAKEEFERRKCTSSDK